jgi:hypothetical protein
MERHHEGTLETRGQPAASPLKRQRRTSPYLIPVRVAPLASVPSNLALTEKCLDRERASFARTIEAARFYKARSIGAERDELLSFQLSELRATRDEIRKLVRLRKALLAIDSQREKF